MREGTALDPELRLARKRESEKKRAATAYCRPGCGWITPTERGFIRKFSTIEITLVLMEEITTFQAVTLAIATVGAVLGVINTWRSIDQSRVKLKVVPAHAIPYGGAPAHIRFCVQVTNLSQFGVTVDDAGVLFHGSSARGSIINPVFADNGSWPRRLEPRSSVSIYSELPISSTGKKIKCAYARTQCGRTVTGTSPALVEIANER